VSEKGGQDAEIEVNKRIEARLRARPVYLGMRKRNYPVKGEANNEGLNEGFAQKSFLYIIQKAI
jgi:hypothetical protein